MPTTQLSPVNHRPSKTIRPKWRKARPALTRDQTLADLWDRRWARPRVRRQMVLHQAWQVILN